MNKIGEVNYSPELSQKEVQALHNWDKPKIRVIAKKDMAAPLADAVGRAYLNLGHTSETKALTIMVDSLIYELKESFPTYSLEEVCTAIDQGSKGKLNDLSQVVQPVMSVMNILKWVLIVNQTRREAIAKQRRHEDKMAQETSEADRIARTKEFEALILQKYSEFPKSLENENYGSLAAYYRHLDSKQLVNIALVRKKEIFAEAEKMKEEDRKLAEELLTGIKIEYTAREIAEAMALKEVFAGWKEYDYPLEEKLNESNA